MFMDSSGTEPSTLRLILPETNTAAQPQHLIFAQTQWAHGLGPKSTAMQGDPHPHFQPWCIQCV